MIEIKKRELEARLYFAFIASLEGYSVVSGKKGEIYARRNLLKPGIVVFKSIGQKNTKMIDDFIKCGYEVVAWDEEAFVTPKKINFFIKKRINKNNLEKLRYFFSWGEIEHSYLCKTFPDFKDKIKITGNSRVDILKDEYNKVLEKEIENIKSKYGDFTLFAGNFTYINDFNVKKGIRLSDNLHKQGIFKKGTPEHDWVLGTEKIGEDVFNLLPNFFEEFSKSFPDRKMIIRPHPGENINTYYDMANGLKNILIIQDDRNALSWIKASNALISSNCTTSVEAYLLNRISINIFATPGLESQEFYLPRNVSINTSNIKETIEALKNIYNNSSSLENIISKKDLNDVKKNIKKALHNVDVNICSVKEMLIYLNKINLKNNKDDKNINKYYFFYYLLRSYLGKIKYKVRMYFASQKQRDFEKYMKAKTYGLNIVEVKEKFKIISNAGRKNQNDFDVKEIIPRIFCVEKKLIKK